MLGAVSDNRFENYVHTQFIETPGEEEGIGVLAIGRQELRADGDDFSVHDNSVNRMTTIARVPISRWLPPG